MTIIINMENVILYFFLASWIEVMDVQWNYRPIIEVRPMNLIEN